MAGEPAHFKKEPGIVAVRGKGRERAGTFYLHMGYRMVNRGRVALHMDQYQVGFTRSAFLRLWKTRARLEKRNRIDAQR